MDGLGKDSPGGLHVLHRDEPEPLGHPGVLVSQHLDKVRPIRMLADQ